MKKARILAGIAAALLLAGAMPSVSAADGLQKFAEALRDAPPGVVSYQSGKALGDNGFVLEDVLVKPPADAGGSVKTAPIHIKRLTVADFDFGSLDKDASPAFAKLKAEDIAIDAASFGGLELKQLTGRDKLTADFQLDYRVDPERKALRLNRLELDLHGLARIEFSMVLDGIDPDNIDSASSATLRTASLVFDDRSLLGAALPAAAKAHGINADRIVQLAETMLDSLRTGQGAAAIAVLDALASYVKDYKQPKGPLRVTLNPAGNASIAAIAGIKDPEAAIKLLGLTVSYPAARPPIPRNPDISR
jgi:hypothetical protein